VAKRRGGRHAANLTSGYFYTPIAVAIVELGIPALLADKALTAEEVAAAAGTAPDATELVAGCFLTEVPNGDPHILCQVLHTLEGA
jgi:hypothetical protein